MQQSTRHRQPEMIRDRRPAKNIINLITLLVAASGASCALAATPCEGMSTVALENARVTASTLVAGPSFTGPDGTSYTNVPSFCKVSAVATPAPDSVISIELWLPASRWNGRFQGVGNGGYAGTIAVGVPTMIRGLKSGFAVASTDMGTAPSVNSNADVLIGHPEKWADFGSRATHLMTAVSKQLIASYYSRPPEFSYFNGCSTGGQQALMSAQRYPADYDGILAGAPANNRTHAHAGILWNYNALNATATSRFTASQAKLVTDSVVAACNVKSGGLASDKYLTDPRGCDWDPGVLTCNATNAANCLTPDQVMAARKIYAGPSNPATQRRIFPGSAKGSENDTQLGWSPQGNINEPRFGSLFKWVFGPAWLASTFDFDQDMASLDAWLAPVLNANSADLSQFKNRGGKLLAYHGWADPIISPQESINYYLRVAAAQANNATVGLNRTQSFYRLFMVPGMQHCAYGPGPNAFGNLVSGLVVAPEPPYQDATHDALVALQHWVEQGVAPNRLVATKYVQDQPALGIEMMRPICPYPQMPKYSGSGDSNVASSFICTNSQFGQQGSEQMPAPEYLQ